jgi:GntR family transcriptional regulator/MocR family aminotransferase
MPRPWTTQHGLDLLVELDARDLRGSLERGLRSAIRSGRLAPGTRLPSSRTLAADLGLARGTVTHAYEQLGAEGYLCAVQGSGTTVASVGAPRRETSEPQPADAPDQPRWDLIPGSPDLSSFPRAVWSAATRRVMATCANEAFGYGDPRGRVELRRSLADYLGRVRGVVVPPDRLVICSGYGHALALLTRVLADQGHRSIAFEDPSYPDHRAIALAAGLRVDGVRVDDKGARVDEIPGRAVVVTPAHQFPLGVTLHPERRATLARWASRPGRLVVEDDYDGEFRYDRQPVGALHGLAPDAVAYVGTASKTLAPGLRLAWLALPTSLVQPVLHAFGYTHHSPSVVDQLVLSDLIDTGHYDRHVRQCRTRYRRRRDLLVAAVDDVAAPVRVTGISAGLHALLELDGSAAHTEASLVGAAQARGLALQGRGDSWHPVREPSSGEARPTGLVVGYASPPDHAFRPAIAVLADVLAAR